MWDLSVFSSLVWCDSLEKGNYQEKLTLKPKQISGHKPIQSWEACLARWKIIYTTIEMTKWTVSAKNLVSKLLEMWFNWLATVRLIYFWWFACFEFLQRDFPGLEISLSPTGSAPSLIWIQICLKSQTQKITCMPGWLDHTDAASLKVFVLEVEQHAFWYLKWSCLSLLSVSGRTKQMPDGTPNNQSIHLAITSTSLKSKQSWSFERNTFQRFENNHADTHIISNKEKPTNRSRKHKHTTYALNKNRTKHCQELKSKLTLQSNAHSATDCHKVS